MKFFLLAFTTLSFLSQTCNKQVSEQNCFKGKLAIKGICNNYTITLVNGNLDASKIEGQWTDENTGKVYKNAFALGNPCSFPATIKEGEEFYFVLEEKPENDCQVCMAYYPKPAKALSIKVLPNPCK